MHWQVCTHVESIRLLFWPVRVIRSVVSYGHVHARGLLSRSFTPASSPCPFARRRLSSHPASTLNSSHSTAASVHGRSIRRFNSRRRTRCCIADARSPGANTRNVRTPSSVSISLWLMLPARAASNLTLRCSCVGQLIGGGESGPEVMQVMQQIAASIGSYSATQAASAPCSAADILDGASKEFLVRVSSFSSTRFFFNPPYQSGSASGAAPAGLDFGGIDSLDDEELNGPMQVACCAAGID